MGVRVRIRLTSGNTKAETTALVNTGFEAEQPEILLPAKLAERLGLYPPPEGSLLEEYSVVGGTALILRGPGVVQVQIVVEDRETSLSEAIPLISDKEEEVLISDRLASRLKIAIDDAAEGTWRFRDEPLTRIRASEGPTYWT